MAVVHDAGGVVRERALSEREVVRGTEGVVRCARGGAAERGAAERVLRALDAFNCAKHRGTLTGRWWAPLQRSKAIEVTILDGAALQVRG